MASSALVLFGGFCVSLWSQRGVLRSLVGILGLYEVFNLSEVLSLNSQNRVLGLNVVVGF